MISKKYRPRDFSSEEFRVLPLFSSEAERRVLTRSAPDPKPGHDRVRRTVQQALFVAMGKDKSTTSIDIGSNFNIKDQSSLGQGIMHPEAVSGVNNLIDKKAPQDDAVSAYLAGEISNGHILLDAQQIVSDFELGLRGLIMPHIFKLLHKGKLVVGEPLVKFVAVRHGEKNNQGKLTPHGYVQAQQAGGLIRALDTSSEVPITGIFGVQQPNVQMFMTALQAGTLGNESYDESVDIASIGQIAWKALPTEWKEPYKTGEVTLFEILVDPEWDENEHDTLKGSELKTSLRNFLQIRITRNNHTGTYDMLALDTYHEMIQGHNRSTTSAPG